MTLRLAYLGLLVTATIAEPCFAQSISESKDEVAYRVKDGDSLIRLAQKYFRRPDTYQAVQRLNAIPDPNKIRVGSTIIIPTELLKYSPISGKIVAFRGQLRISTPTQTKLPEIGMIVPEGALIETSNDGYLTLQLTNGSRIALPSNSRVRIPKLRKYLLTGGNDIDFLVEKGRTETSVTPLKDNRSRFRMRTPVAVSAVRGTVFRIGYDGPDDPSLTEVVEGKVAVNLNSAPGEHSLVPTGFGAAASKSGKIDQERLLPPPALVDPTALQRRTDVTFTLTPTAQAVGYHVQVAKDAGFVDIVAAVRGEQPAVSFGNLPNGKYFVRAMAVAPSGLEGLSKTFGFDRQLSPLSSKKLRSRPSEFILEWQLGSQALPQVRVQLFAVNDRSTPVIDEVGVQGNAMTVAGLRPGDYVWRVGHLTNDKDKLHQYWTPFEELKVSE